MTRARTRHPPRRGDEVHDAGVSSVLGAVLVFGLLVVTLVTVQVRFVPRWEEDREGRHMDTVIDQLTLFKADVERLTTNATTGAISDPLTPRPSSDGFRLFRSTSSASADLELEPSASGTGIQLASPLFTFTQRAGQPLFALGETWIGIPASGQVDDLSLVEHLRVRIIDPNSEINGDTATLQILDADGDYAGKAVLTFLRDASERSIETQVYSAASSTTPITIQRESYFHQVEPDYVYVNLLDDELLFDQVLAAAEAPFDLVLTRAGLNADYTVAFTTSTGQVGGDPGGLEVPNYSQTMSSGSLVVDPGYQHLPQQTFILEHGALLLVQDDGAAMVVPPSIRVTATAEDLVLDMVLPGLDGSASGLGGARRAVLVALPTDRTDFEALAARFTLTVPTEYPDVWVSYFDELLEISGLSDQAPNPQYVLTPTANSVQVEFFGPLSSPGDLTDDIVLRFQQATIDLDLRPTG